MKNGIIGSEGDDIMSEEVNTVSEVKNQESKEEVKQEVKVQETKPQETKIQETKVQEAKSETQSVPVKAKHRKFSDLTPSERQSYYKELDDTISNSQKTNTFQNTDLRRISAKYNMQLNSVRHYYLDHGGFKLEDEAKPTNNKPVPENVETPSKVDKQQLKEKGTKVMENVVKETTAPKPVEEDRKQERKAPEPSHTEEERQVVKQEEKGFDIVEFFKKHWIVVLGGAIAAVVIIFLIMRLKNSQTPAQTAQSIPSHPQNVQTKPSVQSTAQPMQDDSGVITIDKLIKEGRI